jgi:hypothetical protein
MRGNQSCGVKRARRDTIIHPTQKKCTNTTHPYYPNPAARHRAIALSSFVNLLSFVLFSYLRITSRNAAAVTTLRSPALQLILEGWHRTNGHPSKHDTRCFHQWQDYLWHWLGSATTLLLINSYIRFYDCYLRDILILFQHLYTRPQLRTTTTVTFDNYNFQSLG